MKRLRRLAYISSVVLNPEHLLDDVPADVLREDLLGEGRAELLDELLRDGLLGKLRVKIREKWEPLARQYDGYIMTTYPPFTTLRSTSNGTRTLTSREYRLPRKTSRIGKITHAGVGSSYGQTLVRPREKGIWQDFDLMGLETYPNNYFEAIMQLPKIVSFRFQTSSPLVGVIRTFAEPKKREVFPRPAFVRFQEWI